MFCFAFFVPHFVFFVLRLSLNPSPPLYSLFLSPFPYNIPMNIHINGQPREVAGELTVTALLDELGYGEKRVAVERNGELVPKSRHGETVLADGDRIEIVQAIGGG